MCENDGQEQVDRGRRINSHQQLLFRIDRGFAASVTSVKRNRVAS